VNAEYIERMEHVLELYSNPYDPEEPVIGLDEKTLQLLESLHAPVPMSQEHGQRVDYQYKRKGTVNIFVGIEPKGGCRFLQVKQKKARVDLLAYLYELHLRYPEASRIHIIWDNLSSHLEKGIREAEPLYPFLKRFEFHYTPKHGSWLNVAELEIGIVERQCLKGIRFSTIEDLEKSVNAWQDDRNVRGIKIDWKFTKEDAQKAFKYEGNRLN
jgi:transposase